MGPCHASWHRAQRLTWGGGSLVPREQAEQTRAMAQSRGAYFSCHAPRPAWQAALMGTQGSSPGALHHAAVPSQGLSTSVSGWRKGTPGTEGATLPFPSHSTA